MAVKVTEEESSLKAAMIVVESLFSEFSFEGKKGKTWNEWNRSYEKQKRRFLKGKISSRSFYFLLKRLNIYFKSIKLPEDKLFIFPLEDDEISAKTLRAEELEHGYVIINSFPPLIILLIINVLVSFLLMTILNFQQSLITFTDVLLFVGIIELTLGTLIQLGKTFEVLPPQKIPKRQVEEDSGHQVRGIINRRPIQLLWQHLDIYMIILGFIILIISILHLSFF